MDWTRGRISLKGDLRHIVNQQPPTQQVNALPHQIGPNAIILYQPANNWQIINSIFGRYKLECMLSQRCANYNEVYQDPINMQANLIEAAQSHPKNSLILITFTEDKAN